MPKALAGVTDVQKHRFSGPHPSGDPEVQINFVCPPGNEQKVWFCRAWTLRTWVPCCGRALHRARAEWPVVGDVATPKYVEAFQGAPVASLIEAAGGATCRRASSVGAS